MTGTTTGLLLLAASLLCICVTGNGVVTGDSDASKATRKLLQCDTSVSSTGYRAPCFGGVDYSRTAVTADSFASAESAGKSDVFASIVARVISNARDQTAAKQEIGKAMAAAIAAGPDSAASKGVAKATAAAICTGGITTGTPAIDFADVWKIIIKDNRAGCSVLAEAASE